MKFQHKKVHLAISNSVDPLPSAAIKSAHEAANESLATASVLGSKLRE